ncbi:methionine vitamin-b12 [Favolaschia claudopus]|uniref:Methionine vitamin-b12 n=1 Tax=Favolaschia claudopus TaxID=2862362 RepID=A0AAW0EFV0_9AGAR
MSGLKLRPPFRVEHIGSLVRPKQLYDQLVLLEQGKCAHEDLVPAEDAAVARVVELQRELGLGSITDGDMRRSVSHRPRSCLALKLTSDRSQVYFQGVFDKLEGMTFLPHLLTAMGVTELPSWHCSSEISSVRCKGKIKRTVPFYVDQFKALKAVVPPEDVGRIKVNFCPPTWIHQRHGSDSTYDPAAYQSDDEYFNDLGVAYRAEIKELYDLGCRNIQLDDPTFCFFCSDDMIKGMEEAGVDHEALLETYIRAINLCTVDRPQDLHVGLHMCRGNFMGMHFSEGGYHRIAAKLFNAVDVDTFYLEYDNERSGDFTPLKHLPLNKAAVLGIVTTKSPKLEDPEALKARVYEAVDVICKGTPPRSRETALNQFVLTSAPSTCDNVNITWTGGSGGGYYLSLTPIFGAPLNISIPSTDASGTFSTVVPFNSSDQLVLTLSDASGFGSGGSSKLLKVGNSLGGTCNLTEPVLPFTWDDNSRPLVQCQTYTFSGYGRAVQPVTIYGIIPGGDTFALNVPNGKSTFDWTAEVFNGTQIIFHMVRPRILSIVAGKPHILQMDANGNSGGSVLRTVGLSGDTSCIKNGVSPSSTADSDSGATSSPSGSGVPSTPRSNVGAIAGSVLGALIFLAVLITLGLFFLRQRQEKKNARMGGNDFRRSRPLNHSELDLSYDAQRNLSSSPFMTASSTPATSVFNGAPPAHYQSHSQYLAPEADNPFGSQSGSRHTQNTHNTDVDPFMERDVADSTSAGRRKSAMAGIAGYKPSRYVLHTDAEDDDLVPNSEGVVELPPQYSAARRPAKGLPPTFDTPPS